MNYNKISSNKVIEKTVEALLERGFEPFIVTDRKEALEKIKELIPKGASVNNGSSRTLEEIGFVDYLKAGKHPWKNLHAAVVEEKDPVKKTELRNQSLFAEYYLGSVHAIAETGEMIIASASGSQLPPIVFTSKNIIFVVGSQKITPTYTDAMKRVRKYVVPLEDERMKSVGMGGTILAKILTLEHEPVFAGRKVRVIIVKERLGF